MLLGFRPSIRKLESRLKSVGLTERNRKLLALYLRDCPPPRSGEAALNGCTHYLDDLYKAAPNSTRGKASGVWFFDIDNVGETARRFLGRSRAIFHVCEAELAGAELFWRSDLNAVMESRFPVVSRFTVFTTCSRYELEHLALPIFSGRSVKEIAGAFDFIGDHSISETPFCWTDVRHVEQLYAPLPLPNVLKWRCGGAARAHGVFNSTLDELPGTLPFCFRATPDDGARHADAQSGRDYHEQRRTFYGT